MNISTLGHTDCCGCKACGDVCPVKCISFSEDKEGFMYPNVDEAICISCEKCKRACPEISPKYNAEVTECHAAYAAESKERHAGSSGGIFGLLALDVIKRGGKVWGAAFDDNLKVRHVCAESKDQIGPILKSKYIQSNTQNVYSSVLKDVKSRVLTLFSGTPCQCNAIRNIVGDNEFLITIEIVCHGVPSQSLFDKSIEWVEDKENCKITNFTFRSKFKGASSPRVFSYTKSKGGICERVNGMYYKFPFYFGFYKYITLRPSCYSCKWARSERTADITLGDFWGIEKYSQSLDANQGISQIIINSKKGTELFENVKDNIWSQSYPIDYAIKNNGCLNAPTTLSPVRRSLFTALENESFDVVVRDYLTPKRMWILDLYFGMPEFIRQAIKKIIDKI